MSAGEQHPQAQDGYIHLAFIGVLLGGGTAADAPAAQVLALAGLLAAQAITATVLLHLMAMRYLMRADLLASLPQSDGASTREKKRSS